MFSLIRGLIVDDQETVRQGVRSLLGARSNFEVCGEAVDAQDGLEKALQLKPDVVVMGLSMPNLNGFEAARLIHDVLPDIGILILGQHESPETSKQAFRAGALGYVLKSNMADQLESAVEAVSRRKEFVAPAHNSASSSVDITESERTSARLAAIVDSSDDAIVSKDLNGIITSWNPAAERIFGYSAQEAVGRSITMLIPAELRDEETQILSRLRAGERIEHFETVRVTKNGERLNVSLTVSPIKDSRGRVMGASKIARDITQRVRTEKELLANQGLLRAAFAQTYAFLVMLSTDGTVLEANRAALEGTGFNRHEVVGRKLWDVWWHSLPEEQVIARTSVETAAKGVVVREECQYVLRDGTVRFADRTLNPVQNERGAVVMIVASALDITEHRQLRGMLEGRVRERTGELEMKNLELMRQTEVVRELSARLLQIQDEERRRIARELHDSVGQMLAAVNMNLAHVAREADALSPESARALADNSGLLEQISTEIRTISHLLHPPLLDEVGLQSALKWYIDGFSERSKIQVTLELPEDFGRLPRNLEITLFRVVQECLTNIHRHSGSSTAAIRVTRSENEVRLEVRDAGRGIPAQTQNRLASGKLSGVGLRGMQERLRQIGGQLEVQSNGSGTQVSAALPIEIASAKQTATSATGAV